MARSGGKTSTSTSILFSTEKPRRDGRGLMEAQRCVSLQLIKSEINLKIYLHFCFVFLPILCFSGEMHCAVPVQTLFTNFDYANIFLQTTSHDAVLFPFSWSISAHPARTSAFDG